MYIYCKNLFPALKLLLRPSTQRPVVKASLRMQHERYMNQSPRKALVGISSCCSYFLLLQKSPTPQNPEQTFRQLTGLLAVVWPMELWEQPRTAWPLLCGNHRAATVRLLPSEQEQSADHHVFPTLHFPLVFL